MEQNSLLLTENIQRNNKVIKNTLLIIYYMNALHTTLVTNKSTEPTVQLH